MFFAITGGTLLIDSPPAIIFYLLPAILDYKLFFPQPIRRRGSYLRRRTTKEEEEANDR